MLCNLDPTLRFRCRIVGAKNDPDFPIYRFESSETARSNRLIVIALGHTQLVNTTSDISPSSFVPLFKRLNAPISAPNHIPLQIGIFL